jgi:thioredoxin reductase
MHDVIIVGDGPGGLSAALFLGKAGKDVVVFGKDESPMHRAMLRNYLGVLQMTGTEFQRLAHEHAQSHGAKLRSEAAETIAIEGESFTVAGADGVAICAKYLVLANGDSATLDRLGVAKTSDGYTVDVRDGRTSVPRLYALGWAIRRKKIQAVISAGDGAAIALDILSAEAGRDLNDFDVVDR